MGVAGLFRPKLDETTGSSGDSALMSLHSSFFTDISHVPSNKRASTATVVGHVSIGRVKREQLTCHDGRTATVRCHHSKSARPVVVWCWDRCFIDRIRFIYRLEKPMDRR